MACGSRDAQTLALTEDGLVYSWGDGDFGKLGRGGSEGCSIPHNIEKLNGAGIIQIECGAQFSLALSRSGMVWTWGKGTITESNQSEYSLTTYRSLVGDYFRLGHGADQHIRKPTVVECLRGKKIVHVAVGALHCLAVTDGGQVLNNSLNFSLWQIFTINVSPRFLLGETMIMVNKAMPLLQSIGNQHWYMAWKAEEVLLANIECRNECCYGAFFSQVEPKSPE